MKSIKRIKKAAELNDAIEKYKEIEESLKKLEEEEDALLNEMKKLCEDWSLDLLFLYIIVKNISKPTLSASFIARRWSNRDNWCSLSKYFNTIVFAKSAKPSTNKGLFLCARAEIIFNITFDLIKFIKPAFCKRQLIKNIFLLIKEINFYQAWKELRKSHWLWSGLKDVREWNRLTTHPWSNRPINMSSAVKIRQPWRRILSLHLKRPWSRIHASTWRPTSSGHQKMRRRKG